MFRYVPAVALSLMIAGCATTAPNYASQAMSVSLDMPKAQALGIMGPPKRISAKKTPEGQLEEKYSWWSPKRYGLTVMDNEMLAEDRVYITFRDGKVAEIGDKFDPMAGVDKALEIQAETLKNLQNQGYKAPPTTVTP